MKSIIVKNENGVSGYNSGWVTDGYGNKVERTDEEEWQCVYQHLIDDTRRKDFDKAVESLLVNYLRKNQMENWTNIEIKISYSDSKRCEMNVGNDNNIQWQSFTLPEDLPK